MGDGANDGFVLHPDLGLGWFDATSRTSRFFDSPATADLVVPFTDGIRRAILEKEQRVWWNDGGRWLVGRVDSPGLNGASDYFVHFPNGRTELLPAGELKVRWRRPVGDPVSLLQVGAVETRFFHSRRSAFLNSVTEQRAACEGLGGVLSSAVALHAHQLGAARRVLLDPVRRYLLADEVGLGKTIEAGMVMRQVLLDEPGDVLVLAPGSLVGQWQDELSAKFRVGQFGARVAVHPHAAVLDIDPEPRLMIVVDEAHRLTENVEGGGGGGAVYERLRKHALESSSLLLLTATPVRSNEDAFLRLLHLLDPSTYPLSDLGAFRQRVAIRDDLAESISAIDEGTPLAYLGEPARNLQRVLPDDALLEELVDQLQTAVETADEGAARAICRHMRTHVGETYRIHRRMIRARRTASVLKSFPVRGRRRDEPWTLNDPDPRRPDVLALVDGLRTVLAGTEQEGARRLLRVLLARSLAPTSALGDVAAFLGGEAGHDLSPYEQEAFRLLQTLGEARRFAVALREILSRGVEEDRERAAVAWARGHVGRRQVAVACSFTNAAARVADLLEASLGAHRVSRVFGAAPESERMRAVHEFNGDPDRTVVVLDRFGEEGFNLQVVAVVLHLDLPTTMSRIEQRLGRFDRWSDLVAGKMSDPVRSIVFTEGDALVDEHLGAWRRGLDEGVGIFERSTATLQYLLPEVEQSFLACALDAGLAEAGRVLASRREELARQGRRIAGQDILDAIDDHSDDERYLKQLVAVDNNHALIARAFKGYASDMLGLTATNTAKGVRFGVSTRHPPLLTESSVMSLGPERLRPPYESERRQVQPGSGFLRWGEPLVNSFVSLVLNDDRGRAYIVELPQGVDPEAGPHFLFCFDVVVEPGGAPVADLRASDPPAASAAAVQLLRFLAPQIERVWLVPGRGEPPGEVVRWLEASEGINLGSRPDRLEQLTQGRGWVQHCEEQAHAALRVVANRPGVKARLASAQESARRSHERERAIAGARVRAGGDHAIDERVMAAVTAALVEPRIDIDSCGAVIVTPRVST